MALAEITDPHRPYTRRSFSELFLKGRAWLDRRFAEAGLTMRMDTAGNLIGRRDGANLSSGVIALGSHSDTVPSGGRFDGIAGLAAALEVVRALNDNGDQLDHTIEVIDFLAEEPSEFGIACFGSRGMAGTIDSATLDLVSPGGEKLRDALRRIGGNPDQIANAKRSDVKAFLELHIEQGIVLESQSLDVGIVTSVCGIRRLEIIFEGGADHAGTTPMNLRRDALVAAAETVVSARRLADELASDGSGYFVATVGVLDVEPGAINVISGFCRLVIDVRSTAPALMEQYVSAVDSESSAHAAKAQVKRRSFAVLSDSKPRVFDDVARDALHQAARKLGLRATDLPSGAGHDAGLMSGICKSAMVFVPCKNGNSHSPEEWSDREQVAAGAAVIFEAVKSLDRSLRR